jgi:hypothetical protein
MNFLGDYMEKYDPLWNDINKLLLCLRDFNAVGFVDDYYFRMYDNEAPGELLKQQIDKLQEYLDNSNG